jgi:hypothetical protein
MRLFGKKLDKIPNQEKIEALELELGFTPVVTEQNFEREFDRALINDYRQKHGSEWVDLKREINYLDIGDVETDENEIWERLDVVQARYEEVESLLMLEESRDDFIEQFNPYSYSNR